MSEVFTEKEFKRAMRKARMREWVSRKTGEFQVWFRNNREFILIVGPTVIGATTTLIKVVSKYVSLHKEKVVKDLYCYDRSLGHYWRLKRELSNHEWVEIDRRKQNGERLADILSELRVLK